MTGTAYIRFFLEISLVNNDFVSGCANKKNKQPYNTERKNKSN